MGLQDAQPPQPTPPDRPATEGPPRDPTSPTIVPGEPAGTGVLRGPDGTPREVPLMSIRKDAQGDRVAVGPLTRGTGVADVLMGSIGLVLVVVAASVLVGAVLGSILILLKHRLGWGGPEKDAEEHISLTDR